MYRCYFLFLGQLKIVRALPLSWCCSLGRSKRREPPLSIEGTRAGEKRRILRAVPLRQPVCERPLPQENPCTDSSRPRAFDLQLSDIYYFSYVVAFSFFSYYWKFR